MTTDELLRDVRELIRRVMEMPEHSVQPEGQRVPAGGQVDQKATVKLISSRTEDVEGTEENDTSTGDVIETKSTLEAFTFSVNFYRGKARREDGTAGADRAGLAKKTAAAFDMAARLNRRLRLDASRVLMTELGIGFISCSDPRDLSELADAEWESRGQVDLEFYVVSEESAAVGSITSGSGSLLYQSPGGKVTPVPLTTSEVP